MSNWDPSVNFFLHFGQLQKVRYVKALSSETFEYLDAVIPDFERTPISCCITMIVTSNICQYSKV